MRVGRWSVLLVPWVLGGCALALGGHADGPRAGLERDGVVYWAYSHFLTTQPVRIRTIVGATNERARAVVAATISCGVFVRLHGAADREGLPVWDERVRLASWRVREGRGGRGEGEGEECRRRGRLVEIEPGGSRWLTIAVVEPGVIGDTIPPGRYYFTAVVPVEGETIEFIAGDAELPAPGSGQERERGARDATRR